MTIPRGHRFEATQALRQTLARAVSWGMLNTNPAKEGVENPQRPRIEQRPIDSWADLRQLADQIGPRHGPLVLFAAATGLRPSEWIALEHRDIDHQAGVLYVKRAFRNGRLKCPKTDASTRAVPLQAIALAALEELPPRPRQPDHDRPPLRPPRQGRPPARDQPPRHVHRGRPTDVHQRGRCGRQVDAEHTPRWQSSSCKQALSREKPQALCRTRTDDPFLTMTPQAILVGAGLPIFAANKQFQLFRCSGTWKLSCALKLPESFHSRRRSTAMKDAADGSIRAAPASVLDHAVRMSSLASVKSVGVEEFLNQLTTYVPGADAIAVSRRGRVIGFYVPVRRDQEKINRALDDLGETVEEILKETGMSEQEFTAVL
jgi:hypothetical protein